MKRLYNFFLGVRCDKLGRLDAAYVAVVEQQQERWQNDALTGRVMTIERGASFVTAGRQLPAVRGGLWRRERRLR